MKLLVLSKDNLELARAEAGAVLGGASCRFQGALIITDSRRDFQRLAYTTHVVDIFIISSKKAFFDDIKAAGLSRKIKGTYSVRKLGKSAVPEKIVADIVWNSQKSPRVDLKNPNSKLVYLESGDSMYLGKLLWENDKDYLERAPHLRPVLHPSSLPPKLARACVNLLGIGHGTVLDPFCGTGGILIEAGLMGFRAVGFDIDKKMIMASEKNLDRYNIQKYGLFRKDALSLSSRYRYIVTDLPYGRNTRDIKKGLYSGFLACIKRAGIRRAVVIFPGSADHALLVSKAGLKQVEEFSHYVHKGMTKKITVIGNQS